MKVSIVTVLLNAETVIGSALTSVAAQDYPTIEQIIVDGGSTDSSMQIVEQFRNLNFTVISEPDAGIFYAMNKGIALASGDAILFLNADDRLANPSSISDLVKGLIERADAELAFGDVLIRDEHQDIYRSYEHITSSNIGFEMVCHQTILARKGLFGRVGSFDTNYRICADLDWLLRCVDADAVFAHVPRVVCCYATGGESDKLIGHRMQERDQILSMRRTLRQRLAQRLASAWRRRVSLR